MAGDQAKAQAKLIRSLAVMNDALLVAVTRTAQAVDAADEVSDELGDALEQIHSKLYESHRILDELLAEFTNPPPGP